MRLTEEEYNRLQKRGKLNAAGSSTGRAAEMNRIDAGSSPAPRPKGQLRKRKSANKTEFAFGQYLRTVWPWNNVLGFEAISLRMPGGTLYTPDWPVEVAGKLQFYEVKGHMREAARVRLKEFAAHFGDLCGWKFFLVRAKNRALTEWEVTQVG